MTATTSIARAEEALKHASQLELKFDKLLLSHSVGSEKANVLQRDVDEMAAQLRDAYQEVVFHNMHVAKQNDVEGRLWRKHHQIIERFRNALTQIRDSEKRKPVELRKLNTNFVAFIKNLTKFYRAYIQRLASHFEVEELAPIVREFRLEVTPSDEKVKMSDTLRRLVIESCFDTLIRLGDLSRYRESDSVPDPKKNPEGRKNWGPATGYYSLAKRLNPDSGTAHNQLALIARSDHSSFGVIYHLYRALSVSKAFKETFGNLSICFKRLLVKHQAGILKTNLVVRDEQSVEDLIIMFMRLHAQHYTEQESSETDTLKSEMLNQLALAIRERAVAVGILNKMVLINIAAEFNAYKDKINGQLKGNIYLRLNIETFTSLLLVFLQELERVAAGGLITAPSELHENVTAVVRRMLPCLRLYSIWLLVDHKRLTDQLDDTSLNVQIKQLWQIYASTLSGLLATFPMRDLPSCKYLLEEDEDILGFKPFAAIMKERIEDMTIHIAQEDRDHPNQEVLARVLYLIEDGIELCTEETVPVTLKDGNFTFQDGIISSNQSIGYSSSNQYPPITVRDIPMNKNGNSTESLSAAPNGQQYPVGSVISEPVSATMTVKLNAMVDDLVGSNSQTDEDDEEEEEILFRGKHNAASSRPSTVVAARVPVQIQAPTVPTDPFRLDATIRGNHNSSRNMKALEQAQPGRGSMNASDLVNLVQNYSQNFSLSPHPDTPKASHAAAAIWSQPSQATPTQTPMAHRPSPQLSRPLGFGVLPDSSIPEHPSSLFYQTSPQAQSQHNGYIRTPPVRHSQPSHIQGQYNGVIGTPPVNYAQPWAGNGNYGNGTTPMGGQHIPNSSYGAGTAPMPGQYMPNGNHRAGNTPMSGQHISNGNYRAGTTPMPEQRMPPSSGF